MKPAIIGLSGPALTPDERSLLQTHQPRGVIMFHRNIESPAQLAALIADVREMVPDALMMVDQEGGRVARLRPPHWPEFPAAGTLKTTTAAYAQGQAIGAMLRTAGFDIATAPVLDLRLSGASSIIGDRGFSDDGEICARLGAALAAGLMSETITPVMKHIPGHGRALVDSHLELPFVEEPNLAADFLPFIRNRDLPWAMTAHVVYTAYDSLPATLSKITIQRVIRGMIGFTGTLITDDLSMHALTGTPAARAQAALAAGCDVALYCTGDIAENVSLLEALAHVD
jgi:beta-N-acetylhexosaminidase